MHSICHELGLPQLPLAHGVTGVVEELWFVRYDQLHLQFACWSRPLHQFSCTHQTPGRCCDKHVCVSSTCTCIWSPLPCRCRCWNISRWVVSQTKRLRRTCEELAPASLLSFLFAFTSPSLCFGYLDLQFHRTRR